MKRLILFGICFAFVLLGCADNNDQPLKPKSTPGQQTPVAWPSLADTPWPMNHHDPQSTGRSSLLGPASGTIALNVSLPTVSNIGVAIAVDSTILGGGTLVSVNSDGTIRWSSVPTVFIYGKEIKTTPIIASNGDILVATNDGIVYALRADGTVRWQYATGASFIGQGSVIGKDGTFYSLSLQQTLYAFDTEGRLAWSVQNPKFCGSERAVLTISPDGKTMYIPGKGVSVLAFDLDTRTVKWTFGSDKYMVLAPMVDSDGNIYVLGKDTSLSSLPALYSLRPDGSVRWSFVHGNRKNPIMSGDPVIDREGNVTFAFDTLYSVDHTGALRWKLSLEGGEGDAPLVCDAAGTIYAVVGNPAISRGQVWAISSQGTILWKSQNVPYVDSSPAITHGRKLVLLGWKVFGLVVIE